VLDANKKAAEDAVRAPERAAAESLREWERLNDQIGQSLTDAIMDGGRSAKDLLEDVCRTMVLRPLLQPVVNSVTGAVGQALGIPGAGGASGNVLGTANSLSSIYSAFTGGITGPLAAGVGALGSAIGSSVLQNGAPAISGKGATLAAGLAGPTAAGAGGAVGLGSIIGAAAPWLAGGLALYSLFGDKVQGETRSGGQYGYTAGDMLTNNRRGETIGVAGPGTYFLEGPSGGTGDDSTVKTAINSTV